MTFGFFFLSICLHFDTDLHMFCENAAFIEKKSRRKKFDVLFIFLAIMIGTFIYYNLDLFIFPRPPIEWYTNSKDKCSS